MAKDNQFQTVGEVWDFAMKHYDEGGDAVASMTNQQIVDMVYGGIDTPEILLQSFREFERVRFAQQQA